MEWDEPGVVKIADSFTELLSLLEDNPNKDFESRYQTGIEWYQNSTGFPTERKTEFPREPLVVSEATIAAEIDQVLRLRNKERAEF